MLRQRGGTAMLGLPGWAAFSTKEHLVISVSSIGSFAGHGDWVKPAHLTWPTQNSVATKGDSGKIERTRAYKLKSVLGQLCQLNWQRKADCLGEGLCLDTCHRATEKLLPIDEDRSPLDLL